MGSVYVIVGEKTPTWPRESLCTRSLLSIDFTGRASMELFRGRVTTPEVQLQNIYAIVWLIKRFTDLMKVGLR